MAAGKTSGIQPEISSSTSTGGSQTEKSADLSHAKLRLREEGRFATFGEKEEEVIF